MKIHRKDIALKDNNIGNTITNEEPIDGINTVNTTDVNTVNTNALTTIEPSDMANTLVNTPAELNPGPPKNDATFFTADSSGTVTLPNYSTAAPMNISQSEVRISNKEF